MIDMGRAQEAGNVEVRVKDNGSKLHRQLWLPALLKHIEHERNLETGQATKENVSQLPRSVLVESTSFSATTPTTKPSVTSSKPSLVELPPVDSPTDP